MTTNFKIGTTDIVLLDYKKGGGKIIISSNDHGCFDYEWLCMGSNIKEFLLNINADYFARKLSKNILSFSSEKTIEVIKDYIKNDIRLIEGEFDEEMGILNTYLDKINEYCRYSLEFVEHMLNIWDRIKYLMPDYKKAEKFKKNVIDYLQEEPQHFIQEDYSDGYIFLSELLKKIQKELKP
ncbi:hypothetical protein ETU10_08450 [Apibacter muscae]|uniref:hypothetical protein n=1 Tax=Apibacter muscae TaxID=2509004 RepID=UPI0011ABE929|nr:hypothetical protein [Apibacter muscae]TWP23116.1 hypothetical protein ETU10_08450 [Apibacter muscae]